MAKHGGGISKKAENDRKRVIAAARRALSARNAEAAVPGYNARTARLDAARKRAETAPTPEQQAKATYVEADVNDYVGGTRVRVGRAFKRQPRFETIEGVSVPQLLALRRYRRAFDTSEVSPVKSGLDIGVGGGGGGMEAALARIEAVAFSGIEVDRIEQAVSPNLLGTLRDVALHDHDFTTVAVERYGSASGKRRQQVKGAFLLAAQQLVGVPAKRNGSPPTPAEQAAVTPAAAAPVDPAFLDDQGYLRPWSEIAHIVRSAVSIGVQMASGMFRLVDEHLGECVRMSWGADPACFLTKDTYEANGHQPPFDELPTRDQYIADHQGSDEERA